MKCKNEEPCEGEIDLSAPVVIQLGHYSFGEVFPCKICKRLHWRDGMPLINHKQQRAFLKNKAIIDKPPLRKKSSFLDSFRRIF